MEKNTKPNKIVTQPNRGGSGHIEPQCELVKAAFLAFRYSVSEKYIRKRAAEGYFPKVVLSRKCVRFPLSECDEIVGKRRIKSMSEIAASTKA